MFVNDQDKENEKKVFEQIRNLVPAFENLKFVQTLKKEDVYDFLGYRREVKLDIKVRNIRSTDYPDFFISKEKVEEMKAAPTEDHYIAYQFTKDQKIRVYHLNKIKLEQRDLNFVHRRSGKETDSDVFLVPSNEHILEVGYV